MSDRKRKLDVGAEDGPAAKAANMPATPQINPYTGRPYSARYYDILSKRTGTLNRQAAF